MLNSQRESFYSHIVRSHCVPRIDCEMFQFFAWSFPFCRHNPKQKWKSLNSNSKSKSHSMALKWIWFLHFKNEMVWKLVQLLLVKDNSYIQYQWKVFIFILSQTAAATSTASDFKYIFFQRSHRNYISIHLFIKTN